MSLIIKNGVDAKIVSERIGHTNPGFTQTVYQHLYDDQRGRAALGLMNMLEATPKERLSN